LCPGFFVARFRAATASGYHDKEACMAIWDIFKAAEAKEARATGRITDLRVETTDDGERWVFRLEGEPEEFVYEPSALSPRRRRGEQVVLAYDGSARDGEPRRAEWITSA
jgi:hypothetical protein